MGEILRRAAIRVAAAEKIPVSFDIRELEGTLRCSPEQLEVLDNRLKVATRKTGFTCETLVSDAAAARRALPDAVIDRASIEDIMQFYTGRDAQ